MTTKELESKLKISENTGIHCSTLELAKQVLSIFDQLRLKWRTERNYMIYNNWDIYKENTVYYPFDGEVSPLKFAQEEGYKIISAEEFISLHTGGKEFDLENYEPKGELTGFPKEIIKRMLECQEEQGNKRDISVFEEDEFSFLAVGGFDWDKTKERYWFWEEVIRKRNFDSFFKQFLEEVIREKNFDLFFKQYPKQDKSINIVRVENKENNSTPNFTYAKNSCDIVIDTEDNSQEFKIGDKVYDIMCKSSGIITNVSIGKIEYPLTVELENGKIINTYTIDGRINHYYKTPQLLHYRDDYDYSVIDFNNLPKRQEVKRWRAEEGGCYHFVSFDKRCWFYSDESSDDYDCPIDNNNYNSGNYFRTEVEAEIIAQKLNTYFKQLIKEEHDTHRN